MHIVPLIVGEERAAMSLCQEAIERGVFAQAIRPPDRAGGHLAAAPDGDGLAHRLRSCATRGGVLGEAARAIGLEPGAMTPPWRARAPATE